MADKWLFDGAHVELADWMAPFGDMFTAPTWQRVLVLLIGAVLSPGRRTVAAALRVTGLDQDPHFTTITVCSTAAVDRAAGWHDACSACWSTPLSRAGRHHRPG